MYYLFRRLITVGSITVFATALAWVQTAEATGTYYVDSTTGNDANNCTSADTACLTVPGAQALIFALPDPANTTLKLRGTFTDEIRFMNSSVTKPDTLDGLRITAIDANNQPIINTAVAGTSAVTVFNINHLTIDHLTITGGTKGIHVTGSSVTYVGDSAIHHNDISGISTTALVTTAIAIDLEYAKSSTIHDNTIHDVAVAVTDTTYSYLYGIYVYYGQDITVRRNTISTFGLNSTLTAAGSHSGYVYTLYLYSLTGAVIEENTLSNLTITETATVTDTSQSASVYGLYGNYLFDTSIANNTFSNISSTIAADIDVNYGSSGAYGIFVSDIRPDAGVAVIENNTIDTVTASQSTKTGTPAAQGITLQWGYGTTITLNTIQNITTVHTSSVAAASTGGSASGISGPYFGGDSTVSQNTISTVSATAEYTVANSGATLSVRGIYQYSGPGTITDNTISNLSWSINNHDTESFYDYATIYGIDSGYSNGSVIKNNVIQQLSADYSSAGVDGTAIIYMYALAAAGSDNLVLQKNTVQNVTISATVSDPTDEAYLSMNIYGLFLNKLPNAVVHNNRLKHFTISADAGNNNALFNYTFGLSMNYASGTFSKNRIVDFATTSTVASGGINHLFYGMNISTANQPVAVTGSIIRDITSTTTGESSNQTDVGMLVSAVPNLILEGNQIRPFITSAHADADRTLYGIDLSSDASHARVLDNIILGDSATTSPTAVGVYLASDSTVDLDLIHNTIANWKYPVQADGGNKIYLRNNILAAVGADSYALAIGRDTMNNDTFKSDYNLLYNATVADQLVYDTDNTLAILLVDWTNVGGSWGYDVNSVNKPPKINALGRLLKGSKAINVGSKDYPYNEGDAELTYLATDINGDNRPITAKKKKVDIGADEYKK